MTERGKWWRGEPEAVDVVAAWADPRRGPCGAPWEWHQRHDRYVDVDDMNVVYTACYMPGGSIWGDATIHAETTPARAEAIRRAAAAYRAGRGTKPGLRQ